MTWISTTSCGVNVAKGRGRSQDVLLTKSLDTRPMSGYVCKGEAGGLEDEMGPPTYCPFFSEDKRESGR
jgi:hypothetical protein